MATQTVKLLYCSRCGKHTDHVDVVSSLTTRCTVCNTQTGAIERNTAKGMAQQVLRTPDGYLAEVVEYTPKMITFYVSEGPHKGYYHYDRQTHRKTVTTRGLQPDIH